MPGHISRTRLTGKIVAEFLPPSRERKTQKVVILCDGMPSIPRKQSLSEFLATEGFWVIYPRYRGAWESGGEFLERSPHEDILDIIDDLPKELEEIAFGRRFRLSPDKIFVIGGSFGGAVKAPVEGDLRKQFAHRLRRIGENYVLRCQNAPVVQQFAHSGILRHEIHEADWHLPTANAALRASAEVTLHENAVRGGRIVNFLARMQDVQFFEIALRNTGRAEHSIGLRLRESKAIVEDPSHRLEKSHQQSYV